MLADSECSQKTTQHGLIRYVRQLQSGIFPSYCPADLTEAEQNSYLFC